MIPCKDCLMIPACRHKHYGDMVIGCPELRDSLYSDVLMRKASGRRPMLSVGNRNCLFNTKIRELFEMIGPSKWRLGKFRRPNRAEVKIVQSKMEMN